MASTAIITVVGVVFWYYSGLGLQISTPSKINTSSWNTYTIHNVNISFRYPSNFTVTSKQIEDYVTADGVTNLNAVGIEYVVNIPANQQPSPGWHGEITRPTDQLFLSVELFHKFDDAQIHAEEYLGYISGYAHVDQANVLETLKTTGNYSYKLIVTRAISGQFPPDTPGFPRLVQCRPDQSCLPIIERSDSSEYPFMLVGIHTIYGDEHGEGPVIIDGANFQKFRGVIDSLSF